MYLTICQFQFPCIFASLKNTSSRDHKVNVNWGQAIKSEALLTYIEAISLIITPLLNVTGQSIESVNDEIAFVCDVLVSSATNYLPTSTKCKQSKPQFNDSKLKNLCQKSKKTWRVWNASGRPNFGQLYDEMKSAKKDIRNRINILRAKSVCKDIQRRDLLFKTHDPRRFKTSSGPHSESCNKLKSALHGIITDPTIIASEFSNYFTEILSPPNDTNDVLNGLRIKSYSTNTNMDVLRV